MEAKIGALLGDSLAINNLKIVTYLRNIIARPMGFTYDFLIERDNSKLRVECFLLFVGSVG